ncbi:N-acetylglucosamine kinase [Rhizobium sp. Leaf384]|uniref:ROK family protein n=1 Tax=unclassified Rhizobium TaxID=2613769 RepID=UPI0007127B89|nr:MULTISPECIES: ROK family protein [unclassified Rhizobium]KQR78198.1 N-acetylglucosamine kinase [Rhizobium sp. Leaf341]KQS81409.1 N-acetylglucosamine kinase [Rhizobium sp. Leaf384]KQS87319.1 N-acetylglucosamine kinase [Rhizobium sp. Leaf383]
MIVCFDIGGSAIKGAVATAPQDIRPLARRPTPLQDFDAFVRVLEDAFTEAGFRPSRIALSIAGVVDPDTQAITVANIPCLDQRPLARDLGDRLRMPVLIANDADCFALAEAGLGAGRGHRVVFGIILGTGVGGGLVADGRLINGQGGFAGEWGHGPAVAATAGSPPVAIPAFACGCGQSGCVDTIGAARGMERLHKVLHQETLPSQDITARWQAGDPDAARTIEVLVDLVSSPLALAINITGATIVPVGGGLSGVTPLVEAIDRTVRSRILRRFDRPLVVPGECRIEPGLIGAALLALDGGPR